MALVSDMLTAAQIEELRTLANAEDRSDDAGAKVNAGAGKQPAPDESADNADDNVADYPEPGSLHDLPCQPAGDYANEQNNE